MRQRQLKVLSLFAGCGGMDLGFKGGFEFLGRRYWANPFAISLAVDFDSEVVDLYNQNAALLGGPCTLRDVRDIAVEDLPAVDFVTAGFPCQPFSNAGKRKGVHDDDGRGVLFEECERLIRGCQSRSGGKLPIGFVFENVKGILSTRMPNGRTVPDEIVRRMAKLGFNTVFRLVRASDFGVPQNRERVLMVGLREGLPPFDFGRMDSIAEALMLPSAKRDPYELLVGWWLSTVNDRLPNQREYWRFSPGSQSMVDKIGPCEDGAAALKHFLARTPLDHISPTICRGRSWKNIAVRHLPPRFRRIHDNPEKYRAPNFYRRFALGEICGTVTASAQPENAGITHPFENRRFSVREIGRIQSFPDDFDLSHRRITAPYKGVGNAVPPILAWVLASAVAEHLGLASTAAGVRKSKRASAGSHRSRSLLSFR